MAVNRERLELFYSISCQFTLADQRMLAAIGFEFEIAEAAFTELAELCEAHTDSSAAEWSVPADVLPKAAVLARAFVDHSTRVQKMVQKFFAKNPVISALCDTFYRDNEALFLLRNALHHQDERIESGKSFELLQPSCGDISWLVWTEQSSIDLYWGSFGPIIGGEAASPGFGNGMITRHGLNEIIYRSLDIEVRLIGSFRLFIPFIEQVHDEISARFDQELQKLGVARGGPDDLRLPAELGGRLRIEGFEASPVT